MMLPPTSSRKAVRLRNASAITGISEIYGFLISTWIGTQTHQKKTLAAPATWMEDFRIKLIGLSDQIQTAKQMTELAKWEGNIRGKWPIEEYQALIEAELQMISGLAQVIISVIRFWFMLLNVSMAAWWRAWSFGRWLEDYLLAFHPCPSP
jgi:hypothetical protein